jgi:multidrug efflux pump subunit AcrB
MLAGTLVTIIGLMPVGFAQSTAGEYAGNIFWVVAFALITSWFVAVIFTPYLGVLLIPKVKPVEGGHGAIYDTPRYRRLRALVSWTVTNKFRVALGVAAAMIVAVLMMGAVKKQFFPNSDRPEALFEVQMPEGSSIGATSAAVAKVEAWLRHQPEAKVVTSYIGQGAPRFFLAISPELPDPAFAKIVVLTPDQDARDRLKRRFRAFAAGGAVPEARLRATQIVFGPPSPFPVAFRVMGPETGRVRDIAEQVRAVMLRNGSLRQVNTDWGERAPTLHFVLDQDRLRALGLSSQDAAEQLQFLLSGVPVTQVREDIRSVEVVARTSGADRLDPSRIGAFTLVGSAGQRIPLDQIGRTEVRMEDPILRRRDRLTTITVRGDIADGLQPPDVSVEVQKQLKPVIAALPAGYRIEMAGPIEESAKANAALAAVFPIMFVLMMLVLILQVRSLSAMFMVLLTAPLALVGVTPTLLIFNQPFGFNAILGLIGLAGIIMRNSLILIGQIHSNQADGLAPFDAVVEATVQRARPVILTALAAVLAFIPLTFSVFWSQLAYVLIGGTIAGTVLTLAFLPALYAIWFKIGQGDARAPSSPSEPLAPREPGFVARLFRRGGQRPRPAGAAQ